MKKLSALCFASFLGSGVINPAGAIPTYVDGTTGSTPFTGWSDVNKTNVYGPPDSLLCWAAVASNLLSWTGWWGWDATTHSYLDTADEIYNVFDNNWSNRTGATTFAYEWWMTNRTESIIKSSPMGPSVFTFDSPGLNFYPSIHVQDGDPSGVTAFILNAGNGAKNSLQFYVNNKRGIAITVEIPLASGGGTYLHSLTVWGLDYDNNKIFITDSDDGSKILRTYDIFQSPSGGWYIDDYTNLYTSPADARIWQITRLNRNDSLIKPNGAPEPTTLALLGLGLAGAAYTRRKKTV